MRENVVCVGLAPRQVAMGNASRQHMGRARGWGMIGRRFNLTLTDDSLSPSAWQNKLQASRWNIHSSLKRQRKRNGKEKHLMLQWMSEYKFTRKNKHYIFSPSEMRCGEGWGGEEPCCYLTHRRRCCCIETNRRDHFPSHSSKCDANVNVWRSYTCRAAFIRYSGLRAGYLFSLMFY